MAQIESLNHTAMPVHDMAVAEAFYCDVLGAEPYQRTCFQFEDVKTGAAIFQSYVIGDFLIALTVARQVMDMPADDQFRGAHGIRLGFAIRRKHFHKVVEELNSRAIPYKGPVDHPEAGPLGQSLYLKDPSGNFLELVWRRDEDPNAAKREFSSPE